MTVHYTYGNASIVKTREGIFRSERPMTESDIAKYAPAALAAEAHESRSDRYQVVPTMAIAEALRKAIGVEIYGAKQVKSKNGEHAKHVLRLRRPEDSVIGVGSEFPELILTNSYDGSSSYKLDLGMYRLICNNGMVVGKNWDSVRVRHQGETAIPEVVEETRRLSGQFDTVRRAVDHFKAIALEPAQIRAFNRAALMIRHESEISDDDVSRIQPRRGDDRATDLWTVSNVAQEAVIRGGYRKETKDQHGNRQLRRVRPVTGIDQNTALNQAIWSLTEEMAKLAR